MQACEKSTAIIEDAVNFLKRQRPIEAAKICHEIIRREPMNPDAWSNLGVSNQMIQRFNEAIDNFNTALTYSPNNPNYLYNLASVMRTLKRYQEAKDCLRKIIDSSPNFNMAYCALADILINENGQEEAIELYMKVEEQLDSSEIKRNLGFLHTYRRDYESAMHWYQLAYEQDPSHINYNNIGITKLEIGDFSHVWTTDDIRGTETVTAPVWNGEPVDGCHVLLWAHVGLGDNIQFSRYYPMVKNLGASVTIACDSNLMRLFDTLPGSPQTTLYNDQMDFSDEDIDYHAALMDLPRILGTTMETIPSKVPYLKPDPVAQMLWAFKLNKPGLKIGIAWQGNPALGCYDKLRSFKLDHFEKIAKLPDVTLYSIQKNAGTDQLEKADFPVVNLANEITDMMDTAAIIANLDLIITPDSSIAHLAGALAKPAWIPLPYFLDWKYRAGKNTCPWYPTWRLWHQPKIGDWESIFNDMETKLRKLLAIAPKTQSTILSC